MFNSESRWELFQEVRVQRHLENSVEMVLGRETVINLPVNERKLNDLVTREPFDQFKQQVLAELGDQNFLARLGTLLFVSVVGLAQL